MSLLESTVVTLATNFGKVISAACPSPLLSLTGLAAPLLLAASEGAS
eukprot:CAMPEP_0197565582 /NCGR_PEP_ID=MMETSP1320-20131121/32423_1 /TAXON_ID=91990 /ORGANISM="Bolidomonas sp., Strain RCC2347" /LENGTH=46 /DNA_ID= /DNA_START= /DNA_END= /DNA_ORIENTATION=